MAFDSFRAQESVRPRRQRQLAFALVAIFHGVLIAAGVIYSYWHVEELTPPTLRVTFMSGAPPPPPPPPPPGGGGARAKKVAVKTKPVEPVPTKPPEIVQPPEKPRPIKKEFRKHEDEYVEEDNAKPSGLGKGKGTIEADGDDDGEEGGVAGGVKGGQRGGVIGGTIGGAGPPAAPKIIPPNVGSSHRQGCAKPDFPLQVRKEGVSYLINAKICVTASGTVDSVSFLAHDDPRLQDSIVRSEKACHYSPFIIGSIAAPFCYVEHFEFKTE